MNKIVCFIGSKDTARLLAKESTTSDLEISHFEDLTIIRPLQFPEKITPLIQAVSISDYVVVELTEVNQYLGEVIILLELLSKPGEFIVSINNQHLIEQVKSLAKLDYEFKIIKDNSDLKDLRNKLQEIKPSYKDESLIIIDHFFNVKNIGTVALGFIKGGAIKVKERYKLIPGEKEVQINSMQSMDVDYRELSKPSRIGVSLKNCNLSDLERGSVLSNHLKQVTELTREITKSKYYTKEIKDLMIINGLLKRQGQFIDGKISLIKPIVMTGPSILYKEGEKQRVIGIIK